MLLQLAFSSYRSDVYLRSVCNHFSMNERGDGYSDSSFSKTLFSKQQLTFSLGMWNVTFILPSFEDIHLILAKKEVEKCRFQETEFENQDQFPAI